MGSILVWFSETAISYALTGYRSCIDYTFRDYYTRRSYKYYACVSVEEIIVESNLLSTSYLPSTSNSPHTLNLSSNSNILGYCTLSSTSNVPSTSRSTLKLHQPGRIASLKYDMLVRF